MYSVYAIRCKENGKIYIGCTKRPDDRVRQHFCDLNRRVKSARHLDGRGPSDWQIDYDNYGESAFECYIVEENIPEETHRDREQFWIEEFRSWDRQFGYNLKRKVNGPAAKFTFIHSLPPKPFE